MSTDPGLGLSQAPVGMHVRGHVRDFKSLSQPFSEWFQLKQCVPEAVKERREGFRTWQGGTVLGGRGHHCGVRQLRVKYPRRRILTAADLRTAYG